MRSTLPGAEACWPSTDEERQRYAEVDTTAPDAMTPLMKLRRETFRGVSSVIVLSSMKATFSKGEPGDREARKT